MTLNHLSSKIIESLQDTTIPSCSLIQDGFEFYFRNNGKNKHLTPDDINPFYSGHVKNKSLKTIQDHEHYNSSIKPKVQQLIVKLIEEGVLRHRYELGTCVLEMRCVDVLSKYKIKARIIIKQCFSMMN